MRSAAMHPGWWAGGGRPRHLSHSRRIPSARSRAAIRRVRPDRPRRVGETPAAGSALALPPSGPGVHIVPDGTAANQLKAVQSWLGSCHLKGCALDCVEDSWINPATADVSFHEAHDLCVRGMRVLCEQYET